MTDPIQTSVPYILSFFFVVEFFPFSLKHYDLIFTHGFGSAQSMSRIEELLQEDQRVKGRRERYQKQSSLLSKLTRQLSIHDNRAAAASTMLDSGTGSGDKSYR